MLTFSKKKFPERFFQCFIAEQAMVGMAVGFATQRALPFVSTFGAFFSRAHDQLRMAAIGNAALRLVGSHAGVSIGEDGPSQMALEDMAMMRSLPSSVVLYPADATSAFKLIGCMIEHTAGISYLRTTRAATPVLYTETDTFYIGGCNILKKSDRDHACIVAAGITLFEALKAYEELARENIYITIIDCYSIKPLDAGKIRACAQASRHIITVEDHYPEGGLGEAVCHALCADGFRIETLAVTKLPHSGKPEELLAYEEIDSAAIVKRVRLMLTQS